MNSESVWVVLERRYERLKTCRDCPSRDLKLCQANFLPIFENAKADLCPEDRFGFIPGRWPSGYHNEPLYQATLASAPPEPEPFTATPIVHFAAHLWPVKYPDAPRAPWLWHLQKWNELAAEINGRCLVGVASGPNTASLAEVQQLLSNRFELFELPNDPVEGENPTFRELLNRLPKGPNDVVIYAHSKGVQSSRRRSDAVRLWTELLYETVVFNWAVALQRLAQGYKAFGSFRAFTTSQNVIPHGWYYSGTFFIVRLQHIVGKAVSPIWGGVEHFLGTHFPASECWLEFADARDLGQEYYMEKMFPDIVMDGFQWEVRRVGGVHCEQHKRELDWFLDELRPHDRVLVIGSRQGGLEHQINLRHPKVKTLSIDCNPMDGNTRCLIVGSSHDSEVQHQVRKNGAFDVVFIDGDHSLEGVTEDWEFALKLCPRLIAFHDISDTALHRQLNCRVDLLWSELQETFKTRQKVVGCGWGGIGVVELEEKPSLRIGTTLVSIIITVGPGYDRFVDTAYQSAIDQGGEVIVVWDSCEVPKQYHDKPHQITVNFRNVQQTRRAGLQAAKGSMILFLDADDVLSPGFVSLASQQLRAATAIDDRVAGVYPDAIYADMETGDFVNEVKAPAWDGLRFESGNFVAISTLVWAHALRMSWWKNVDNAVLEDHAMWLSLTDSGWKLVPGSGLKLHVRTHPESISKSVAFKTYPDLYDIAHQPLTVFVALSGRSDSWIRLMEWLQGLPLNARLVLCDGSGNVEFGKLIRSATWSIEDVRIYSDKRTIAGKSHEDLVYATYNQAFQETTTPFVLVLNDHVIPQLNAMATLRELAAGFDQDVSAVCGVDSSRHLDTSWKRDRFVDIQGSGLGCMLARTKILQMAPLALPAAVWPDLWFWKRIQNRGYRVRLSTRTPCVDIDRQVLILGYHDLDPSERNAWTLSPEVFRSHLSILMERGYKITTLTDAVQNYSTHKRVAVITFDDGRAGCFAHGRQILADLDLKACFYICPGFIDGSPPRHESYSRFMDWSQIKELAFDGHTIGSHSMTHGHFGEMSPEQIRTELIQSRESIDRKIQQSDTGCVHFALPYGEGGDVATSLAHEIGYETVVTTESKINFLPIDLHELRRWTVCSPCSPDQFAKELALLEQAGVR